MTQTLFHYLCIGCPLGCRLEVVEDEGSVVEVRGFSCKRGKEYAEQEHSDPRRMATSTVRIHNSLWPRLPVRTTAAVPKAQVQAVCDALRGIEMNAPVACGSLIAANVANTGIDVVAARSMPRT